jgi:hypothetical protein
MNVVEIRQEYVDTVPPGIKLLPIDILVYFTCDRVEGIVFPWGRTSSFQSQGQHGHYYASRI